MAFVHDIWLYDHDPVEGGQLVIYRPADDERTWERECVPNGSEPAPSLSLPSEALEAIVAAGADHLPPSSAQAAHLADAIDVRDRLLTMVERDSSK